MKKLFYRGINPYSFRSGEWGQVIGTSFKTRWCFIVEYKDGVIDYSPMIDTANYELNEEDEEE
ncbi:hypothetical protein [Aliarcobacter cibarius]|uniref:Uncharacterized protein n=1 Tax=Aliarcobacter cibarius TaxID=255507 RepID=A0ABY2V6N8_9BACT|nr:hypothetical protein [Aliarcobacter cibarius]TLS99901.1 hypothetical protein FE247_05060 [Aliarcobacter cibarius]TLT00310.1 hypothetical protein FE245_05490 [Aliarcobacter cibarius]